MSDPYLGITRVVRAVEGLTDAVRELAKPVTPSAAQRGVEVGGWDAKHWHAEAGRLGDERDRALTAARVSEHEREHAQASLSAACDELENITRERDATRNELTRLHGARHEDSIAWRAACAALAPHAQEGENTAGTLKRVLAERGSSPGLTAEQYRRFGDAIAAARAEERERAEKNEAALMAEVAKANEEELVRVRQEERERAARLVRDASLSDWRAGLVEAIGHG